VRAARFGSQSYDRELAAMKLAGPMTLRGEDLISLNQQRSDFTDSMFD